MKLMLISLIVVLTGCSAVGHYQVDRAAGAKADLHFVGIPVVAGAIGSSFPLTAHYSLTAGHVAKIMMVRVKAYNPTCDVAIIYHDNTGRMLPRLESAVKGEQVNLYGYNAYTALPTYLAGVVLSSCLNMRIRVLRLMANWSANTSMVNSWLRCSCIHGCRDFTLR